MAAKRDDDRPRRDLLCSEAMVVSKAELAELVDAVLQVESEVDDDTMHERLLRAIEPFRHTLTRTPGRA